MPPPALVAVTVTKSASEAPRPEIAGVASLVTSSVDDEPVSEVGNRSGTFGAAEAVVSIAKASDRVFPVFPARSVTAAETFHDPSPSAGSVQLVAAPTV